MKIGKYEIQPVETGRFALDGGAMFGVVPKPLWSRTNPSDERNRIDLAARGLLLRDGERTILVDNGNGTKFTDKQKDIYRLDASGSDLLSSLAKLNCEAGDVTDVLLTHLHFDHAGGSTIVDGKKIIPTFPNARYHVQKAHWDQAQNPTPKDRGSFMPDDFLPLRKEGVLDFVDGEGEIFPGVRVLVMNGHTTAQQLPLISDGDNTLLFCCDLIPTVSHIPLPYIMAYDLRPMTTLEEKRRILGSAEREGWILFLEHDPGVAACRVKQGERGIVYDSPVRID